jgi:hypothetical protein
MGSTDPANSERFPPGVASMTEPTGTRPESTTPVDRSLDIEAAEVLVRTLFRTFFRDGIRVPLQWNGLLDMDVVAKDNNLLLNMQSVEAELPPLSVWRVTLAYRGKPIVEYGRGIKNDVKIHVPRLCYVLLTGWVGRRKRYLLRARAEHARNRDLATLPMGDRSEASVGESHT